MLSGRFCNGIFRKEWEKNEKKNNYCPVTASISIFPPRFYSSPEGSVIFIFSSKSITIFLLAWLVDLISGLVMWAMTFMSYLMKIRPNQRSDQSVSIQRNERGSSGFSIYNGFRQMTTTSVPSKSIISRSDLWFTVFNIRLFKWKLFYCDYDQILKLDNKFPTNIY